MRRDEINEYIFLLSNEPVYNLILKYYKLEIEEDCYIVTLRTESIILVL